MPPKKPKVEPKVANKKVAKSTEVLQENQPIDISMLVKGATVVWKLPGGSHHEAKVLDVSVKDGVRQISVAEKALVVPASVPQPDHGPGREEANLTVKFTEALRAILTDDQDLVIRQRKLVKVPARHTVQSILDDYVASIDGTDEQSGTKKECTEGNRDYFDATLGSLLLYNFERPQHATLVKQEKEKLASEMTDEVDKEGTALPQEQAVRMSSQYGFIHLLRFLVRLDKILSYTTWTPRSLETIFAHAQDLVDFLSKKAAEYYDMNLDYVDATEEYQKSASAPHA